MDCFVPDYYTAFHCLADRCRHTCCAGWEIDVDEEAFCRYRQTGGAIGEKLRRCISEGEEMPHFVLTEGERCPFLQPNGLCELILTLGEDALCQICADHPRFRNVFSGRTELGLGLCCEAAGKLILQRQEPMTLQLLESDGTADAPDGEEQALLSFRDMLFAILQDRSCTLEQRLEELLETCGAPPERPIRTWIPAFLSLERLEEDWTDCLTRLSGFSGEIPAELRTEPWERAFEQAAVYFLYRHLPAALEDGDVSSKAAFAVLSVRMLQALCALQLQERGSVSLEDLVEYARRYSGEIEYSEENLWQLFALLSPEADIFPGK